MDIKIKISKPTTSLQNGNTPTNEYPNFDFKLSDGEASLNWNFRE